MSRLLTHSRLKTARQCARLHFLKYVLGYRPVEDRAELAFGSLIHAALEVWWLGVKADLPQPQWLERANAALRAAPGVDAFDLVRAEVLMFGYDARWSADAALYEVLGVEEQFEFPLRNPATGGQSTVWRVAGKLDVRVRRKVDGSHGLIEHKTSSEDVGQGSTYWRRLRMDSQISIYFDGVAALGPAPEWCLYDVLGKPGIRPLKATPLESQKRKANGELYANQRAADETPEGFRVRLLEALLAEPERYFHRGEVVRLESELDEAREEIWQQGAQLRENENAGRHPRNPDACMAYGRACPFFGSCSGEASLDDASLFTRSTNLHPELADPSKSKEDATNADASTTPHAAA